MMDVGDRVICIESRWGATITGGDLQRLICPCLPIVGRVYTIRTSEPIDAETCLVRLLQVVNPINSHGVEPVFQARQFRPFGGRTTDIGFAHEIINVVRRRRAKA